MLNYQKLWKRIWNAPRSLWRPILLERNNENATPGATVGSGRWWAMQHIHHPRSQQQLQWNWTNLRTFSDADSRTPSAEWISPCCGYCWGEISKTDIWKTGTSEVHWRIMYISVIMYISYPYDIWYIRDISMIVMDMCKWLAWDITRWICF